MSGGWSPKRIAIGNIEGAGVRRGRDGQDKEWIDCVKRDVRAFDIAGGVDWKTWRQGRGGVD